jgi:hypothetical protein
MHPKRSLIALCLPLVASGCGGGCWEVANPCGQDPLGCSDDPNARFERDPSCPAPAAPLTVVLGEGRDSFTTFAATSPLPFFWGAQGGGHVEVGYAIGGLAYDGGGSVRGLRVSLRLDETIPCAIAGAGDLRLGPDAGGGDGGGADDGSAAAAGDVVEGRDAMDGEAADDDATTRCMRPAARRVIVYGTPALPLAVDAGGGRVETGLVLFVDGFAAPQTPARLHVVVEDTCGRMTHAVHDFVN